MCRRSFKTPHSELGLHIRGCPRLLNRELYLTHSRLAHAYLRNINEIDSQRITRWEAREGRHFGLGRWALKQEWVVTPRGDEVGGHGCSTASCPLMCASSLHRDRNMRCMHRHVDPTLGQAENKPCVIVNSSYNAPKTFESNQAAPCPETSG